MAQSISARERAEQWLRGQGYPLEMFVAEVVGKAGMSGIHGMLFEDREGDEIVHRDLDVWGYSTHHVAPKEHRKDGLGFHWHWAIECKRSELAWFLLTRRRQAVRPYPLEWFLPSNEIGARLLIDLETHERLPGLTLAALPEWVGTRLVGEKNKDRGNPHDAAYEACHKVVRALGDRLNWTDGVATKHGRVAVGLTTIVVEGDLYEARMDGGELSLVAVDRGAVVWTHPESRRDPVVIPVVKREAFPDFVAEVKENQRAILDGLAWRIEQNADLGKLTEREDSALKGL